ncbi:MAG: DUF4397 domain-containing protein [Candidatus Eremiobacteraeota bacterium]|nr:DUF4397 domain-containing protein [Candidatus Eremiobacteraeota bacterium]MBV9409683.1 DUF4397 domain-containing protein [Candidatus Eremiobacteraeota bacterium]
MSRNFAGTAARITAVALLGGASACGAIGSGGNPNATAGVGPALLRFVQGSGVRTDNVFDQNGVRCTSGFGLALDGQLVSQPLFYGQITSYLAVSAKTHRVDVYCGSAKTSEVLGPFVTPALAPGSTVSLVTAGRFDRGTLQVMVFVEPPTSSAGTIVFHHAAPEFPTTYDFGALDVMGGTYARLGAIGYSPVDNIPQPSAPSAIVPTPAPLPTNPALASAAAPAFGANGLAVYVGSGTTPLVTPPPTPAPAATVSPTPHPSPVPGAPIYASSIDRNDLANALPFGAEATFSVFVVDPDSGNIPQLIGALE